jgi:2-succinyl-5-enolpyruvyl-6-hydroxy-3-cyclohexene-1-carboxylate synthase
MNDQAAMSRAAVSIPSDRVAVNHAAVSIPTDRAVVNHAEALPIAWAKLFLRAAWHAGVRDVVLSPGSRSTPLAIAAHESPELRTEVIVDERSAAFFALGQARATGRPTVLACTSGTAAAHYFPAIIEAAMSEVPLIALTADRPWELQQAGASQTIDQTRLFGAFVRAFFALGAPEPHEAALRAVARTAAQAVASALGPRPGPVHVNAPFRKPLEPAPRGAQPDAAMATPAPWQPLFESLMRNGPTRVLSACPALPVAVLSEPALFDTTLSGAVLSDTAAPDPVSAVAQLLAAAPRGLVVCGPAPAHGDLHTYRQDITALAAGLGFPILAEATSQMRFGAEAPAGPTLVAAFDALLRSPSFRARLAPDAILEIGAPPTSAGYAQLLAEYPQCKRIVIAPHGFPDPAGTAALLVQAEPRSFCRLLRRRLAGARSTARMRDRELDRAFAAADLRARSLIDAAIPGAPLTEAAVARAAVEACPADSFLMLGNSSPVRDADAYVFPGPTPLRVLHQRGASGIDGLVSGAAGAQHASGAPVTLVLGDLSLLHDLGGLAVARLSTGPLVIVAVNNAGGRIFEQLPIGRALGPGETFERLFATPQPLDLAAAAAAFGVPFARVESPADLRAALAAAHARAGATLIEARVPPHDGAERHKALWARIDEPSSQRKDEPA